MFAIAFDLIVADARRHHPKRALQALPWFPKVVRDIRAFRVEQWPDFTGFMKG